MFTIEGVKRGLCAFDDKRYLLADGINTMAHGHYAIRNEQTEEFEEPIPESALTTPFTPFADDEENVDVTGFITLSHADSTRLGLRPHITREEVLAMVGGTDLRREIDAVSIVRNEVVHNDDVNDDGELPHRAYATTHDGDDDDEDDAYQVDELLNIIDVAMHSGMTELY